MTRPGLVPEPGRLLIGLTWVGTAVLGVAGALGAVSPARFGTVTLVVGVGLFVIGSGAFLWAYGLAVGRSRYDAIGVGGLFFLQGSAPSQVRVALMVALATQVAISLAAAGIRPFTNVAFVVLAPVFGLGQAGLWAARHGEFPERVPSRPQGKGRS